MSQRPEMEKIFTKIIKTEKGVHFLSKTNDLDHIEKEYFEVRKKEGRVFSDEMVKMLPHLPQTHTLHNEWLHRAATQKMFCKYLSSRKVCRIILDLGCGSGWFTMLMKSSMPHASIIGLDVNLHELKQAAKAFNYAHIEFIYGDIFNDIFTPESFDVVVLNSSVQYFPHLEKLLNRLLQLLTKHGEIHILDSPIYASKKAQQEAKNRTIKYFSDIGFNNMAKYYHHHTFESFSSFNYQILYDPKSITNVLSRIFGRKISLFPWIRIQNF